MTREQQFFLQVLRDYLNGAETVPTEELDLAQVCRLADHHEVGGIFFVQCASQLRDPALQKRLRIEFGGAVSHASNLDADYAALSAALEAERIPFIPIKGILIAPFYPHPELRTMGDIDLLVHAEDAERIRDALLPLGFRQTKCARAEWDYKRYSSKFELQAEIMEADAPDVGRINAYFNDFWPHAAAVEGRWRLDPSFHFLYLIGHIAKHLRWIGVGYRQFFDLAVLMRRGGERYDWDWIRQEAERIGFFRFTQCCLALNERWFGVPSPYGTDCLTEELLETVTQKIFLDGVFGYENEDNRIHEVARFSRASSALLLLAKLRAARQLALPPYRDLIVSEKYAWLRGKPWLLPAAWTRRALQGKRSRHAEELDAVLHASRRQLDERVRQLRALGLTDV